MAEIDNSTLQGASNGNLKAVADAATQAILMGMQNAVANQQLQYGFNQAVAARSIDSLFMIDVLEGSGSMVARSDALAEKISNLAASVASLQGYAKTSQTIPPETGKVP